MRTVSLVPRIIILAVALSASVPGSYATPTPAAAGPVLDANCPGPLDGVLALSGGRRAETFTVQTTGSLVRAELGMREGSMTSGDYVLQIVTTDGAGVPTDTALASATIPDASVPTGDSTLVAVFDPPVNVVAGQQLALAAHRSGSSWLPHVRNTDPCPGRVFFSNYPTGPWSAASPALDLIFAVFVEPAAAPNPEAGDANAPNATITKGPKDKTKKKTATFEFTGTDTRAVASFQCSLDGAPFASCSSPYSVKVKKGKHTFSVRALDQAGNVGTPASDAWKVKKKRKK